MTHREIRVRTGYDDWMTGGSELNRSMRALRWDRRGRVWVGTVEAATALAEAIEETATEEREDAEGRTGLNARRQRRNAAAMERCAAAIREAIAGTDSDRSETAETTRSTPSTSWCRRCGGPVAAGGTICGEC